MPDNEAKEVLTKGFDEINLKYNQEFLDQQINIAGGYPHALQVLGQNLVNVDEDGNIDADDWDKAIKQSAKELIEKDFFDFYPFNAKQTISSRIMNILALSNGGVTVTKPKLVKIFNKRGVYSNVSNLIEKAIIKEDPSTGRLDLSSKLLATSISFI